MLELFKTLLDEDIDDNIANMFLDLAQSSIKNYLRLDYVEPQIYDNVIVMLALYLYRTRCDIGIENTSEGSKSIKYNNIEIPNQIKAMLPKPRIRCL